MLETVIQKEIITYLNKLKDTYVYKQHNIAPANRKNNVNIGQSDIIGLHKGKFLAIEVKQPNKKATPKQEKYINKINSCGGIGFVAHSLQEVKDILGV